MAIAVSACLSGCSVLAAERGALVPGRCDARSTARRADAAIGVVLLAASIYAASRPSAPDDDSAAAFFTPMVGTLGTFVSLPFLGGWIAGREAARACHEEAGLSREPVHDTGAWAPPPPPPPSATPAPTGTPPAPAGTTAWPIRQSTTPPVAPALPPQGAATVEVAPGSAAPAPTANEASVGPTTRPFDAPWSEWHDDRELAEKLARATAISTARDACRTQFAGATVDAKRLDPSSLECESRRDGAQWRCRYRGAIATCVQ